ncbi:cleavage stimulation factor subunit 3-like [Gastrophryne carolinensis]
MSNTESPAVVTLQLSMSKWLSMTSVFFTSSCELAAEYVPEKVKKAEKKLEDNPYDLDAWSILIREAQV